MPAWTAYRARPVAEDAVAGVGGDAADEVAGVDVLEVDSDAVGLEVGLDRDRSRKCRCRRDLRLPEASRCWSLVGEQVLPGAFGDDDDGVMPLSCRRFGEGIEESAGTVEGERDLGDEAEVDILAGEGGAGGDEAGVAAHELDQADAVGRARGLDVGAR